MRDAVGSTFMFRILIIFIVFFIVFECFTVAYAKTFRLKNGVIDILEHNQYSGSNNDKTLEKVREYMTKNTYDYKNNTSVKNRCTSKEGNTKIFEGTNGVCIISKENNKYFVVYTYIVFKFPVFGEIVIPIGGETEQING